MLPGPTTGFLPQFLKQHPAIGPKEAPCGQCNIILEAILKRMFGCSGIGGEKHLVIHRFSPRSVAKCSDRHSTFSGSIPATTEHRPQACGIGNNVDGTPPDGCHREHQKALPGSDQRWDHPLVRTFFEGGQPDRNFRQRFNGISPILRKSGVRFYREFKVNRRWPCARARFGQMWAHQSKLLRQTLGSSCSAIRAMPCEPTSSS